jgi:N-acetylglucosaminyl-diphospho-decaprenol L-rhamnosyltransferase
MNPQKRKYYVVIVHYGDPGQTKRALMSLRNCESPPNKIVVVDHAESRFIHPCGIVIRPNRNTGFAGGVNSALGALLSRGAKARDIIVIMNNDVTAYPETFRELRRWWHRHPEEALLGVVTEEAHGTVAGLGYVDLITGRTHFRKPHRHVVPYIHGSFFAAPYLVFMKTGGLPEDYFLYWEDAQLSVRAARRHIPLKVSPDVRVVHHRHRPSPAERDDERYYLVRNGARFLEEETPVPWRYYWQFRNLLRLAYHTLRPAGDPIVRRALADARRGTAGRRLTAP